jgi:hypothetical protein
MEGLLKKKMLSVSCVQGAARIALGAPKSVLALKSPACAAVRRHSSSSRQTYNFFVNGPVSQ